jgi:uncharacterized coiled-coil DUF342 family protein
MDSLKPVLSRYLDISKKLQDVNARAKDLREQRQSVELDLIAVYNEQPSLDKKIDLTQSKLSFQVKKPGEWKKGWTLSKKQLQEYLLEILPEHGEDVFREITLRHEKTLVSNEFSFDLKPLVE